MSHILHSAILAQLRYSINFLWINKKLSQQQYIYPATTEEELINKFLLPAIKFAKTNQEKDFAIINIWYDSQVCSVDAVANTTKVISELMLREGCSNVVLKDIRVIKVVKTNEFLFAETMPHYHRIDFLKLIIEAHELISEKQGAAIYCDLEVNDLRKDQSGNMTGQRFNKEELFDIEMMQKLFKCGKITGRHCQLFEDHVIF